MPTIQGLYKFIEHPSEVLTTYTGSFRISGNMQIGTDPGTAIDDLMVSGTDILVEINGSPDQLYDVSSDTWNESTFGTLPEPRMILFQDPINLSDPDYNFLFSLLEAAEPPTVDLTLLYQDGTTALTLTAPSPVTSYSLYESAPDTWTFQAWGPGGEYAEGYISLPSDYDNVGLAYSANGDIIPRTGPFTWGTDLTLWIRIYNPVELELYDAQGVFASRIYNDTAEYIDVINIINYDQYYDDLEELQPGHAYVWINNDTRHGASIAYPLHHGLRGFATSIGGSVKYTPGANYVPQLSGTVRLYLVTEEIPVLGDGELTLYNNKAEASRMDKTGYLSDPVTVVGTFRENTSFTDPEVEICVSADVALSHNYLYSSDMHRWYYIRNIQAISHQVFRLQLHVDVLMTYKDRLMQVTGYCTRNQFEFNPFFMDGRDPRPANQQQLYIGPDQRVQAFDPNAYIDIATTYGYGS